MQPTKVNFDQEYLQKLYTESQEVLLEMAAPSYLHSNFLIRWIVKKRMLAVLRFLNFQSSQQILDFGCGAGILLLQLPKNKGYQVGVDLNIEPAAKMLRHHQREDVKLFTSDVWAEEIADSNLDAIVAVEVLEHVKDLSNLLALFKRKLNKNGKLIISGPTENLIYKLARGIAGFSGHYHVRDIFDIRTAMKSTGFVENRKVSLPLSGFLALFLVIQYRNEG